MDAHRGTSRDDLRLSSRDGTTLLGRSWEPASPRGVLMIVHGLKDHSGRYEELASRLVDRSIAVYAFDLRGHGRSDGLRAWVRRFSEYLEDLDEVLRYVRTQRPKEPLFLFGHSMGGAIATLYVEERAPPLAGLILSAPALQRGANISSAVVAITKLIGTIAPHAAVLKLPNEEFSRDPAVVQGMADDPLISQRPAPARTAVELLNAMDRIRANVARLQAPLLCLQGTADLRVSPDGSRRLVESVTVPDRTLKVYPGLYHDLFHEPERAQVEGDLLAWVDAHLR